MENNLKSKNLAEDSKEKSGKEVNQQRKNQEAYLIKEKNLPLQSRSRRGFWLISVGILIVLAALGASLASCSKDKSMEENSLLEPEFRYAELETKWNEYAINYPSKFKLFGDRGGRDANIIKALEHWLLAFSFQPNSNYRDELDKLKNVYGITTFHAWDDFRREHYRPNKLRLNPGMNYTSLCETINNYIGIARPQKPQDYISSETVKTIVYMNNICAFFKGEKEMLNKEGIDTEISECPKLDPGEKFPILHDLLNN